VQQKVEMLAAEALVVFARPCARVDEPLATAPNAKLVQESLEPEPDIGGLFAEKPRMDRDGDIQRLPDALRMMVRLDEFAQFMWFDGTTHLSTVHEGSCL